MENKAVRRRKLLKEIVLTKEIHSREQLLTTLNKKLSEENQIKIGALDKDLEKANISYNKENKLFEFLEGSRNKAISEVMKKYIKKYRIDVTEPFCLGTSIINSNNHLYLLMVHCIGSHEQSAHLKLKNFICPSSYIISRKCIFYYFTSEQDIANAYELLREKL